MKKLPIALFLPAFALPLSAFAVKPLLLENTTVISSDGTLDWSAYSSGVFLRMSSAASPEYSPSAVADLFNSGQNWGYTSMGATYKEYMNKLPEDWWGAGQCPSYPVYLYLIPDTSNSTYDGVKVFKFACNGGVWTQIFVQPFLGFPLQYNGWTADTADIASVFDHSMDGPYSTNDTVVAYNGETGNVNAHTATGCGTSWSKATNNDEAFSINGYYVGDSTCGTVYYLTYDGHPGYDYPVPFETPVYAAASGTIAQMDCPTDGSSCVGEGSGWGRVRINHGNGYTSWYLHLSSQVGGLSVNDTVEKGDLIGYSGDTVPSPYNVGYHLHFEVRKGSELTSIPVDPYGWTGEGSDPYASFHSEITNIRLWE